MTEPNNVNETVRSIIDTLNGEYVGLQKLGRALSPEELHRCDQISNALPLLRNALEALTAKAFPGPEDA